MGKADLHIHTTVSDGNTKPADIVNLAVKQHLETIAITDHDSIAGLDEATQAAADVNIEVLPGVEITAGFDSRECHLLAYCFDPADPELLKLLSDHRKARFKRGKWIVQQLNKQGLDLDIEEVKAEANGSSIGRPHIAAVLMAKGYVAGFHEAFIRYLGDQALGTIESDYYSCQHVIRVVKQAGGAIVVAHPGQMYTVEELEKFVDAGVDGIEVLHPSHNYDLQKKMQDFAEQHNLLITGGSDFHGGDSDYLKYFGIVTINSARVQRIKEMTRQRKKILVE